MVALKMHLLHCVPFLPQASFYMEKVAFEGAASCPHARWALEQKTVNGNAGDVTLEVAVLTWVGGWEGWTLSLEGSSM